MSLSREELFAVWAPAHSRWSAWAKPVLFAYTDWIPQASEPELPDPGQLAYMRDAAFVLDLPGAKSVLLALALAKSGFQPVPLFNAASDPAALVDMTKIARQLTWGAEQLKALPPRPEALPVFLMNSDRMDNSVNATAPGRFDNRWAVVPQDMPSAEFLTAAGIRKVVLVSDKLQDDLAHVLHRYQLAGLDVLRTSGGEEKPQPLPVTRPSSFKSLGHRFAIFAGLRRNAAGGFGAITPDPGANGGYGGYGGG
jgi:hypothetical protein